MYKNFVLSIYYLCFDVILVKLVVSKGFNVKHSNVIMILFIFNIEQFMPTDSTKLITDSPACKVLIHIFFASEFLKKTGMNQIKYQNKSV